MNDFLIEILRLKNKIHRGGTLSFPQSSNKGELHMKIEWVLPEGRCATDQIIFNEMLQGSAINLLDLFIHEANQELVKLLEDDDNKPMPH